jgi:NTE family protein
MRTAGKLRPVKYRVAAMTLGLGWIALTGCASRIWNRPFGVGSENNRYDFAQRMPEFGGDTFVVLAFSGGGTRAAAFSYGVLEKLRDTPVTIDGKSVSLLHRVNVISSVSGGSYTAAYYGLWRPDLRGL